MLRIRRWLRFMEQIQDPTDGGPPLCKFALVAVVHNPFAGKPSPDLSDLIEGSVALGREMAAEVGTTMAPFGVQSYGKGGVVGLAGEQEHVNAMLTTKFADPLRAAIGGGKAWISSLTKRAAPGATIDIPLAHKDALYVRSHYDGMTLTLHDAPLPDEAAVIVVVANRGRINARVGGLKASEVKGQDGLS
jgi:hypothetical protein